MKMPFIALLPILFVGFLLLAYRPFVVAGSSMQPTLLHDTIVLVETISHRFDDLSRGDVIVFENPHDTEHITTKRVIGLPNEKVTLSPEGVTITHKEGGEEFFAAGTRIGGERNSHFEMQLGPEDYLVLGDNRSASSDSRRFGAVQAHNIIGKAILCFWPLSCQKAFRSGNM